MKSLVAFLSDDSGATAIEYGLLAALVAVSGILSMWLVGISLSSKLFQASDALA